MKKSERAKIMRQRRDAKVADHLQQYAPVWLVDEVIMSERDSIRFNVVFYHSYYGWVNRRYRYDAFNNVLYHQGQTLVSEEDALELEDKKPYIEAETINTIDSYGG